MPGKTRRSATAANAFETNEEPSAPNNLAGNTILRSEEAAAEQNEVMQDADAGGSSTGTTQALISAAIIATQGAAAAQPSSAIASTQTSNSIAANSSTATGSVSTSAKEPNPERPGQMSHSEPQRILASPSPPPAPPVAQAPGPRATALHSIFNGALMHTLKMCSYDNFAACFPTPAKHVPNELRGMWRMMSERFEELAKSEFEAIQQERNVVPSLNELDRLIADAQRRKARAPSGGEILAPPHTLPPQALYLAHLAPHLARSQSRLNARLQTTQSRNAALVDEIAAQQKEIVSLLGNIEGVVQDLSSAAERVWGTTAGEAAPLTKQEAPVRDEAMDSQNCKRRRLVEEIVDMQSDLDHGQIGVD